MLRINKRGIKKIFLFALLFIIIMISLQLVLMLSVYAEGHAENKTPADIEEANQQKIIDEQIQSGEAKKIGDQLNKYSNKQITEIIPGYDPQKILNDAAKGKFNFSITGILNSILMFLFSEVYSNIHILIKIIILAVLCALLKNLQTSFL